jgi:hydroxymethylglutaryl-CoA lyase
MGLHTGIDLDALIATREVLLSGLPDEVIYGNVPEAGLTKDFTYASERNVK